ncbi:MAG: thymidylate synthase [Longimonas sp.]|uniref:thymidylate synthase n=1 Tax=Longimonas sp. TaxID=2039626 RepID=UPI003351FE05
MDSYLSYLSRILQQGTPMPDRTSTGTLSLFGEHLRIDLDEGFPLLTTKRVWMRGVIVELLWFLRGETNIRPLVEQGVSIWTDWPLQRYQEATGDSLSQEAFEERICTDAAFAHEWGELGPVYGRQWRSFDGVDQIARLVEALRANPYSRRHLVSAWHPADVDEMALPPCHYAFQCHVEPVSDGPDRLSLMWQQRSVDSFLGLPFNIASYALLTHLLAQQTGYEPGTLHFSGGNCHIYQNHLDQVRTQLKRTPYPLPHITIQPADSIFDYRVEDITLHDYQHHPALPAPIAV